LIAIANDALERSSGTQRALVLSEVGRCHCGSERGRRVAVGLEMNAGVPRIWSCEGHATALVQLTQEEMRRINEVAPLGAGAGDRYADMSTVHR
jgi:hypothetical protein